MTYPSTASRGLFVQFMMLRGLYKRLIASLHLRGSQSFSHDLFPVINGNDPWCSAGGPRFRPSLPPAYHSSRKTPAY